ncbi:hypothetical protein PFAG_04305 [Plasmodium falciparum Santa Lucia]|nr:hypothetical protein PFFVO_03904 [Plasmodium falciparum Vietnam Oak-Knoll (FVO)]ETW35020.1 hypothetical protein PFTANZ_04273 [Plasmodium falciparum Tanzania (2000708)]ETW47754.1 hypothetical protein PFMALIP_04153 [Plasmodium falciparum MaliPS096_E11]EUR66752.1 hypothetical protein PFBG_04332 [Plasmodium falciparum 7G8]EUT81086.1 hypothetical protein PFAG_04305 [Plasmodium falciparum Santa Lucia]
MFGKRKLIDSQEPKKKKKWKEELHDDLDDIDLECLKYVEEDVQEDDVDKNTTTNNNNNDDDINDCDNKKSTVYSDLLDEKDKINKDKALNLSDKMELINNISNDNQCVTKKRRYDWMSSDDEDITSDEDEESLINEDIKEKTTDKIKYDTSNNIKDKISKDLEQDISEYEHINNNKYNNNNNEDKTFIKVESKNNSIHNNNITYDILNDINKFSINPVDIKMQDIEHIITYIYFNNIHFNCSIKNFVEFLENNINNKIIQINSDKLTNHTILYKYDEKNNDTVIINKFTHHGKLFVHVKTYEDVVTLLKLNETLFMGRIIKSIQAYRKNDRFFILQAPSQYK